MVDHIQRGYLALLNSIKYNTSVETSFKEINNNFNIISNEYFSFNTKS